MKSVFTLCFTLAVIIVNSSCEQSRRDKKPNILFVISDDQSFVHTSYAGASFVQTPAFDKIAREGVYFTNFISSSPGCAPARSSIVTGRYPWENQQSGQHWSSWMKEYVPFVDELDNNGYITGRTGKGVEPFQYARNDQDSLWRKENAAGKSHSNVLYRAEELPTTKVKKINYFDNFKYFVENIRGSKPFFFWFGAYEPHLPYEAGSWKSTDKSLDSVEVPGFLPDSDTVRGDLLDYSIEIEWYDKQLAKMLVYLEEIGELDNTVIIVTSDNGMPFPRAKANCYEYGVHVPFAVRYPKDFPGNRKVDDLIDFSDLAPTILDIAQVEPTQMKKMSGRSFLDVLTSDKQGITSSTNRYAFSGRERHSSSRYLNLGYPQRAIRSKDFLLIWNVHPERWPAGAPQRIKDESTNERFPLFGIDSLGRHHSEWAFTDIDKIPTKSFIVENHSTVEFGAYFDLAVQKRPEFELYNIVEDPACLRNLSGASTYLETENLLKTTLFDRLTSTKDPRVGEAPDLFDSYQRFGKMRVFPRPSAEL